MLWSMTSARSVRSDQECEFQPPPRPTHEFRSVISSSLSSHTHLHQQASPVSSLQFNVKASSDSKAVWKELSRKKKDRGSVPGCTSHRGFWDTSSSYEDMEAVVENSAINTFEDKRIGTLLGRGETVFLENVTDNMCNTKQAKLWTPPEPFRRIGRQQPLLSYGVNFPGRDESKRGVMPRHIALKSDPSIHRDLAEIHIQSCKLGDSALSVTTGSELSHAESLESVCSSGSSLSLAERVEINRTILRQMLQKAQRNSSDGQQATITNQGTENTLNRGGLSDSDWDSGISLQDSEQTHRPFVLGADLSLSPHHEQAKELLKRTRMKVRSNPLKADHTILPIQRDKSELHYLVRAPVQNVPLVGKERVLTGLESVSDSSGSDSNGGSRHYSTHGLSPTRVRFQDESEKEAEVRFLERQHRRAGERSQGLLGAKPSLSTYINKCRRSRENLLSANSYESINTTSQQCNSFGTIPNGDYSDPNLFQKQPLPDNSDAEGKMVPCWVAPTLPNHLVRIEQIKETYIGAISPVIVESDGTHCRTSGSVGSGRGVIQKQKRKSQKEDSSPETRTLGLATMSTYTPLSNGTAHEPSNPHVSGSLQLKGKSRTCKNLDSFNDCVHLVASNGHDPESQSASSSPHPVAPPIQPKTSALNLESPSDQLSMLSQHHHLLHINTVQECGEQSGLNGIREGNTAPPNTTVIYKNPMMEELADANSKGHTTITAVIQSSQPSGMEQDRMTKRVELATSPANTFVNNGHVDKPKTVDQQKEDRPKPSVNLTSDAKQKEGKAQHALRRFFSAMGLSTRGHLNNRHSGSMEQLGSALKTRINSLENPGQLKKAPSLQNLRLASPFSQLKKTSSAQNLHSSKRQHERADVYSPGEQRCSPAHRRGLQRALSVEDVGSPSAVRSVGRVAQAFPDGTLLLELNRPPDRPFGFLISRGKGRPDSGVYVEDMGDTNTQKLYAGLLGVGDEILEVNGEKVARLSLDLVIQLLSQSESVYIRVLRHRPPHR